MPQLQSIVLTDRATTPVNHTFNPREIDSNGVAAVVETSGVPIGENRLTVSMKKRSSRFAGQLRLSLPVVATETINGVSNPVVIRTAHVTCSFDFDEKSTLQERKDLVGMLASALDPAKVLVNDTLTKVESIY